jgi:lysophospholipase L1-like esterase
MSQAKTRNIALLGDSIFDNSVYTHDQSDAATHLQKIGEGEVFLLAQDGAVAADVEGQLHTVGLHHPFAPNPTHLIVSAGGNDGLKLMPSLQDSLGKSAFQVASVLQNGVGAFNTNYRLMVSKVLSYKLPTVLCTIYNPHFEDEVTQQIAMMGLSLFNDVIIKHAVRYGLPVIDLRFVCNSKADFSNEIEPSSQGSSKIAQAIKHVVGVHDFSKNQTVIYR